MISDFRTENEVVRVTETRRETLAIASSSDPDIFFACKLAMARAIQAQAHIHYTQKTHRIK